MVKSLETASAAERPLSAEVVAPAARKEPREGAAALGRVVVDVAQLAKLRVNLLVLLTALTGFLLALPESAPVDLRLLGSLLGATFLLAASSSSLNQLIETSRDALMERTRDRPIPSGRVGNGPVLAGGIAGASAGVAWLALATDLVTASLGAATLVVYLFVYTPLKRRTPYSLLAGAVAGALPPVLGWTAASGGEIGSGALVLFAVLFCWQVPHFHAIAWLHRDDYHRGGYRLLAVVDPSGRRLARETVVYSLLLVVASAAPVVTGLARPAFLAAAMALGGVFVAVALRFARQRSAPPARRLLHFSLVYLPALFAAWLVFLR